MHFLIDGYNLIYSTSLVNNPYPLLALYNLLEDFREHQPQKTWSCVCDGNPPPYLVKEVPEVVKNTLFWSDDESADDLLIRKAHSFTPPNELCIVTDDKQIKTALATLGATFESCIAFYQRITRNSDHQGLEEEKKDFLSVAEWEKIFHNHP